MTDSEILDAIVADAQATQSIHREMIRHIADWEFREPGRIDSDEDLRNAFVANLEGLRSAFVDRGLQITGVPFPLMLDRANPSHAVILAVRDDIADTRDRVQAGRAQNVVGKQVSDARVSLPERLVNQAVQTGRDLTSSAASAIEAGGKGVGDALKSMAWIAGGGALAYAVYQMTRGGK